MSKPAERDRVGAGFLELDDVGDCGLLEDATGWGLDDETDLRLLEDFRDDKLLEDVGEDLLDVLDNCEKFEKLVNDNFLSDDETDHLLEEIVTKGGLDLS